MKPLMGTFVEAGATGPEAGAAIDAAFVQLADAQSRWSFHDGDSELSRLNGRPGAPVALSQPTLRLLRAARAMMRASGGLFDCTVGGLLVDAGSLPCHGGAPMLARGAAEDIEIGEHWARLRRPIRLTLDGIAKGYAVDLAVRAMRRAGAGGGWVNAGGDVRVFGTAALPMQRRELDGALTPLGALCQGAMASSRAAPLADPRFPAQIVAPAGQPSHGIWTVVARHAWRADALTKVAANAAPAECAALVAALGGALVESPMEASA